MKNKSILLQLTLAWQALLRLLKQSALLPQCLTISFKDRRRQIASEAAEAERLDRIRNPSDYLGK